MRSSSDDGLGTYTGRRSWSRVKRQSTLPRRLAASERLQLAPRLDFLVILVVLSKLPIDYLTGSRCPPPPPSSSPPSCTKIISHKVTEDQQYYEHHQANPHIPMAMAISLDKGWGNPDRNVVAQTICCWWMCGFAWWRWFPSKNHHWKHHQHVYENVWKHTYKIESSEKRENLIYTKYFYPGGSWFIEPKCPCSTKKCWKMAQCERLRMRGSDNQQLFKLSHTVVGPHKNAVFACLATDLYRHFLVLSGSSAGSGADVLTILLCSAIERLFAQFWVIFWVLNIFLEKVHWENQLFIMYDKLTNFPQKPLHQILSDLNQLITSQTRVKHVSRIRHRTILLRMVRWCMRGDQLVQVRQNFKKRLFLLAARNRLSLSLPLSLSTSSYFLSFSIQKQNFKFLVGGKITINRHRAVHMYHSVPVGRQDSTDILAGFCFNTVREFVTFQQILPSARRRPEFEFPGRKAVQ